MHIHTHTHSHTHTHARTQTQPMKKRVFMRVSGSCLVSSQLIVCVQCETQTFWGEVEPANAHTLSQLTHTSPRTHIHKRHLSAASMGRSGKSSAKKRRMLETSNAGALCMVCSDIVHHTWLCLCHVPFAVGAFVFPAADG